jgi:hypothetical protein
MNSRRSAEHSPLSNGDSFQGGVVAARQGPGARKGQDRLGGVDLFELECQSYEALLAYSTELVDLGLPFSKAYIDRVECFRKALLFIKAFRAELRVTVAGESRVGKSTLTRELERFFDQWSKQDTCRDVDTEDRQSSGIKQAAPGKVFPGIVFVEASPVNTAGSAVDGVGLIEPDHLVSDLHIVVLSVERPLTGTELTYIDSLLHDWGRNVIILINKIDLESARNIRLTEERIKESLRTVVDRGQGRPYSGVVLGVYLVSDQFPEALSEFSRTLLGMFGSSIIPHVKRRSLHRLTGLLRGIFSDELDRIKFRISCEGVGTHQEIFEIEQEAEQVRSAARVSVGDLSLFGKCVAGARDCIDAMVWWRPAARSKVISDFVGLVEELESEIIARFDNAAKLVASRSHRYAVNRAGFVKTSSKRLASTFRESEESVEKVVNEAIRRQLVTSGIFLLLAACTSYVVVKGNYGYAMTLLLAGWFNSMLDQSRPRLLSKISRIVGEAQNTYIDFINNLVYHTYDEGVSLALADKNHELLRQQNLQDKLKHVEMMVLGG